MTIPERVQKLRVRLQTMREFCISLSQSQIDRLRWQAQEPNAPEKTAPLYQQLADGVELGELVNDCEQRLDDAQTAHELDSSWGEEELGAAERLLLDLESKIFGVQEIPDVPQAGPIRQTVDPDEPWRRSQPAWRLASLDLDHPRRWNGAEERVLLRLVAELRQFERMTWTQIEQMPHSHPWASIAAWAEASRDRLEHLQYDDQENWYQLQTNRMGRIFGFRSGSVLNIVWWDRYHEVYQTGA